MLKFLKKTQKTARSIDEATAEAMEELDVTDKEDVEVEVKEQGTKGFLGLGSKEASVEVSLKDPNAALVKRFLKSVFDAMNMEVEINARSEEDRLLVDLSGDNMGIVIGKRGDTLDSLQYLTSLVVNHENEEYIKVTVDTENYRKKREEALVALARRLAAKVSRTGRKFTLEPMNPYERRIIHSSLQDNEDVTTYSIGEEPYRKVVISPKNPTQSKRTHSSSYLSSAYSEAYSSYRKTAPHNDTIKKA